MNHATTTTMTTGAAVNASVPYDANVLQLLPYQGHKKRKISPYSV